MGISWDGTGMNCHGMGWDGTEKHVPWTSLSIGLWFMRLLGIQVSFSVLIPLVSIYTMVHHWIRFVRAN